MEANPVVRYPEPWNKSKLVGQKAPFKLGHSSASADSLPIAGVGALQFGHRQQAAGLRLS
jgi:hypothetical protein